MIFKLLDKLEFIKLFLYVGNKMVIQTERLNIIPLTPNQLKLWCEDITALENE